MYEVSNVEYFSRYLTVKIHRIFHFGLHRRMSVKIQSCTKTSLTFLKWEKGERREKKEKRKKEEKILHPRDTRRDRMATCRSRFGESGRWWPTIRVFSRDKSILDGCRPASD